jgi:hypothetical protein
MSWLMTCTFVLKYLDLLCLVLLIESKIVGICIVEHSWMVISIDIANPKLVFSFLKQEVDTRLAEALLESIDDILFENETLKLEWTRG